MSKQHPDIVSRMSQIRDAMTGLADKAEKSNSLSATDEKYFLELDDEFKQLDVQRMKLEREFDIAQIKELAKDPLNLTPGFEAGGAENDVRRSDSTQEHRAGQWLANEPAMKEASRHPGPMGAHASPSRFRHYQRWGIDAFRSEGFIFDFLAAQSVFLRSGVATMETDRDSVIIPHATADAASGWVAEAGTISPTDPTADQITATPRKLAALTQLSNEVVADSNPLGTRLGCQGTASLAVAEV